jgi:hypothetical protein
VLASRTRDVAARLLAAAGSTRPAADAALLVAALDGLMLVGAVDDVPALVARLVGALLSS